MKRYYILSATSALFALNCFLLNTPAFGRVLNDGSSNFSAALCLVKRAVPVEIENPNLTAAQHYISNGVEYPGTVVTCSRDNFTESPGYLKVKGFDTPGGFALIKVTPNTESQYLQPVNDISTHHFGQPIEVYSGYRNVVFHVYKSPGLIDTKNYKNCRNHPAGSVACLSAGYTKRHKPEISMGRTPVKLFTRGGVQDSCLHSRELNQNHGEWFNHVDVVPLARLPQYLHGDRHGIISGYLDSYELSPTPMAYRPRFRAKSTSATAATITCCQTDRTPASDFFSGSIQRVEKLAKNYFGNGSHSKILNIEAYFEQHHCSDIKWWQLSSRNPVKSFESRYLGELLAIAKRRPKYNYISVADIKRKPDSVPSPLPTKPNKLTEIRVIAQTLYGEASSCYHVNTAKTDSQNYYAIARMILDSYTTCKTEREPYCGFTGTGKNRQVVDNNITSVITCDRYHTWCLGNPLERKNFERTLCVSSKRAPDMPAWNAAVQVATEMIEHRAQFLKDSAKYSHRYFYYAPDSPFPRFCNHNIGPRVGDGRCVQYCTPDRLPSST